MDPNYREGEGTIARQVLHDCMPWTGFGPKPEEHGMAYRHNSNPPAHPVRLATIHCLLQTALSTWE